MRRCLIDWRRKLPEAWNATVFKAGKQPRMTVCGDLTDPNNRSSEISVSDVLDVKVLRGSEGL